MPVRSEGSVPVRSVQASSKPTCYPAVAVIDKDPKNDRE